MGKYLHKYQTIEEFQAAYNNDGSSVVTAITISVSAGTYAFYRQEYGGGFYWKDANNNEAYTEKRTPAVGDVAYDITGGWRNVTVASVLSETPEATYIEPWVSLTLEGLPRKVRLWCNGTQHYYGMEYVGPDKTYGDYHKWSSFEIEDRPATDYYYTTTRKLNLGDPVYWSMEGGVDTHEPCAWVESFLEADNRVDYNKKPYIEWLWEEFGSTNPLPDKVAICNGIEETGMFASSFGTYVSGNITKGNITEDHYCDWTGSIEGLTIVNARDLTESDIMSAKSFTFLWSEEHGWGDGPTSSDPFLSGWTLQDGTIVPQGRTGMQWICKIGDTFYTYTSYYD